MFYDKNGQKIREGSIVKFNKEEYTIQSINGDCSGDEGTSTLTLNKQTDTIPCESTIELVKF